jgi:CHAD domain-containing protein
VCPAAPQLARTVHRSAAMAFQVKPDESIAKGLRRLARRELAAASRQIRKADPADSAAVHEARKSIKKVRALIGVMDNDGAHGVSAGEKHLRQANRTLSALRDATAMIEIFDKIVGAHRTLLPPAVIAAVKRQLESHKLEVERDAKGRPWRDVRRQVQRTERRAGRWRPPSHAEFGALSPGLRATHRRGRKAMQRALRSEEADHFHEWRKQIKTLRYGLRLIEDRGRGIQRDAEALDRAQTLLGDEHNVEILCEHLSDMTALGRHASDLERFRDAASRYQSTLRRRALRAARRIYAPGSKAYVDHVKRIWKASGT